MGSPFSTVNVTSQGTQSRVEINVEYDDDFPTHVSRVPFTRYSHFPANNQKSLKQQKNIVVGGALDKGGFFELIVDAIGNSIDYRSFEYHYNKKNTNLKYIGLDNAMYTHSYLVQDNKCIVFKQDECYNAYDIENDTWLLKKGEKKLKHFKPHARSVLINDKIIIVSQYDELNFYFIGNDHITDPILIHKYKLKTRIFHLIDMECV